MTEAEKSGPDERGTIDQRLERVRVHGAGNRNESGGASTISTPLAHPGMLRCATTAAPHNPAAAATPKSPASVPSTISRNLASVGARRSATSATVLFGKQPTTRSPLLWWWRRRGRAGRARRAPAAPVKEEAQKLLRDAETCPPPPRRRADEDEKLRLRRARNGSGRRSGGAAATRRGAPARRAGADTAADLERNRIWGAAAEAENASYAVVRRRARAVAEAPACCEAAAAGRG